MMDFSLLAPLGAVTALLIGAVGGQPAAKRAAPPPPASVTADGVRYVAVHERVPAGKPNLFRASVEARNDKTGQPLWTTKLYEIAYQPGLERDVQEVFVKRLFHEKTGVVALTEGDQHYFVGLPTRKVRALPVVRGGFVTPERGEGPRILDARGGEDAAECEVHRRRLEEDVVRIAYGLIRFTQEGREARERFPYSREVHFGGCLVGPQTWALVQYCPQCRAGLAALQQEPRKS